MLEKGVYQRLTDVSTTLITYKNVMSLTRGISMFKQKIEDKKFAKLVEALKEIHKTTDIKMIPVFDNWLKNKPDAPSPSEIDDLKDWIDPTDNALKGNDTYKVARCLAWYIVTKYLEIKDFENIKLKITFDKS